MIDATTRLNQELQRQIAALTAQVDELKRQMGAGGARQEVRRKSYRVSEEDSARADATRRRDAEFAARTGQRPLGGGMVNPATPVSSTDKTFGAGMSVDTVSNGANPAGSGNGLPSGYGPESFMICESGTVVARNFITDNPD